MITPYIRQTKTSERYAPQSIEPDGFGGSRVRHCPPETMLLNHLTVAERALLEALTDQQRSLSEAAEWLDKSTWTVRNQLKIIRHKLQVQSTLQACLVFDRARRTCSCQSGTDPSTTVYLSPERITAD